MKQEILITAFILLGCLTACKEKSKVTSSTSEKPGTVIPSQDNSQVSLDWQGTYIGVLPCADCEGIDTEITVKNDKTYVIKSKFLGKEVQPREQTGTFSLNESGSNIILDNGGGQYVVGENKLIQLDGSGNKITGSLADKYILLKQ